MKKGTKKDWRVEMVARVRKLIKQADPKIVEEQKYKMPSKPAGIPVWYREGMICTGEIYKEHVRLTFTKGPLIKDPKRLFNTYRAIVISEGDKLNEPAFKNIIRAAVALNVKAKEEAKKKNIPKKKTTKKKRR